MSELSVLVVGGGIAGSVLAYWLGKAGVQVTVIERSSAALEAGQGIDVEGVPREIVRRMGLLEEMKARSTGEPGFACLDDNGQELAFIPGLLTSDIEIMRGDLTDILAKAAMQFPNVTYHYNRTITALEQHLPGQAGGGGGVTVTFSDSTTSTYTLLAAADGVRSRTRSLLFTPSISDSAVKPLDLYGAFYSLPAEPQDVRASTFQSLPQRRVTLIRPVTKDRSSAYLSCLNRDPAFAKRHHATTLLSGKERLQAQKDLAIAIFSEGNNLTGQAPRALAAIPATTNFYFDRIAQVMMPQEVGWSKGRGVLVGDAGYAPGPITGEGTNLAIVGAYVLAGEIVKACCNSKSSSSSTSEKASSSTTAEEEKEDLDTKITSAFRTYESLFRPYVANSQTIPLYGQMPNLMHAKGAWGIFWIRAVFRLVAWSGVWKLGGKGTKSTVVKEVGLPGWLEGRGYVW